MSILDLNTSGVSFNFKAPTDYEYKTLEELYKEDGEHGVHEVKAIYINKGLFGEEPLVVGGECYINLPHHLVPDVRVIHSRQDIIDDINNGKVGFKITEYYQKKYRKTCYGIKWEVLD